MTKRIVRRPRCPACRRRTLLDGIPWALGDFAYCQAWWCCLLHGPIERLDPRVSFSYDPTTCRVSLVDKLDFDA